MAVYSRFLGRSVTVRYRVGEMLLSATGTFCADSGRSIFLEQHLQQSGGRKYFRWEIPYPYIYKIEAELLEPGPEIRKEEENPAGNAPKKAAAAATESGGSVMPVPLQNVPGPLD